MKFAQFAVNVWGISAEAKTDEEIALAGIEALEDFICRNRTACIFAGLGH